MINRIADAGRHAAESELARQVRTLQDQVAFMQQVSPQVTCRGVDTRTLPFMSATPRQRAPAGCWEVAGQGQRFAGVRQRTAAEAGDPSGRGPGRAGQGETRAYHTRPRRRPRYWPRKAREFRRACHDDVVCRLDGGRKCTPHAKRAKTAPARFLRQWLIGGVSCLDRTDSPIAKNVTRGTDLLESLRKTLYNEV